MHKILKEQEEGQKLQEQYYTRESVMENIGENVEVGDKIVQDVLSYNDFEFYSER